METTVLAIVVVVVSGGAGELDLSPHPANSNAAIDTATTPARFRFIFGILGTKSSKQGEPTNREARTRLHDTFFAPIRSKS